MQGVKLSVTSSTSAVGKLSLYLKYKCDWPTVLLIGVFGSRGNLKSQ